MTGRRALRGMLSHPTGNPNVYNAVLGMQRANLLGTFHTCLFLRDGARFRTHAGIDRQRVRQHRFYESARLGLCYTPGLRQAGRSQRAIDLVYRKFDLSVSRHVRPDDSFWYCYEDGALETVRNAKRMGVPTFYELPIAYFPHSLPIYRGELEKYPGLEPYFPQLQESKSKMDRKEEEITLSDTIVCASSFTAQSLEAYFPGKRRVVVGYGAEPGVATEPATSEAGPLRLLFVGRLDPRKGVHRLFHALSQLPSSGWTLDLIGSWAPGFEAYLKDSFPAVKYQCHGQQPAAHVRETMRRSDLLLLPSLFEGFGLVLSEAMALGVAALGSINTALPDLLGRRSGAGIVPAGDTEALVRQLDSFIVDRELLRAHRDECLLRIRERTWEVYAAELAGHVVDGVEAR